MKKIMLFTVLLILSLTYISAQTLADYTFSSTADGTLQDMTGSTALLTAATYHDDDASSVTNIGFTFTFGSSAYTQFSANSNGQMQLGATAISGGSASPTANTPRLAPLSGDNAIRATGKLHYLLTGSAPNRKLVVEWLDLRVNWSSSAETGTYCRMQAWLYEGTNNIKFVYGTMWNMSTSTQDRGVYVSTSNVVGSVGNVTNIITTMAWTNTGTSVVNTTFPASSAMANLNSSVEGSRRVFTFLPPDPLAPPNPAILASPSNGGWALTNATLNWYSGGGMPTSYDIYFGTSATPPFVANVGATTYAPTLAAGTTYYWKIVAKNANGDAAPTATWSFKTPTTTQVAESFEGTTFPPVGWARTTTSTSYWKRSTTYYKQGVASMYAYTNTSSAYNVSTPRVTIVAGSKLNFWVYASSTSQVLQIMYSPDRTTWTQIGANITFAAASTWYNLDIDLSAYAGNNYYLGFNTPTHTTTGSVYVDMVIAPEITPEAPGAPVLSTPADLATGVIEYPTLTWTAPTTGGVPTGYKVYLDTNTTPTTLVGTVTGLTWTPTTPLAYNTGYYWTVKAYNGAGDSTAPTPRSFTTRTDPTIYTLPFTEGFEVGNTDAATVASWSNVYVTGTKNWTANSSVTTYNRTPRTGTFNAFLGWSASTWMIRPVQLTGGTSYDVEVYARQDDADVSYANMTIAYGNAGTATAMTNVIVPQTGLTNGDYQRLYGSFTPSTTGVYYLGILGTLPTSTNWYVSIDDITIRETPAAPIFSLTPTSWDFGQTIINSTVTKQFNISNLGGGSLDINNIGITGSFYTLSANPAPVSLGAGQSASFTVQYAPTAVGTHEGTVTITDGRTVTTVDLDAVCFDPTIASYPYSQNFDGTWAGSPSAPSGWSVINANSDSYTWRQANTYIDPTHSEPYAAHGMGNTNDYLITPPVNFSGVNVRLKWWDVVESSAYPNSYKVLLSTTDTQISSFTAELADITCTNTAWTEHTLNLEAYTGQTVYLAFYQYASGATYYGFGIDDVLFEEIPSAPIFSISPDTWDFGPQPVNSTVTKQFTVANTGSGILNLSSIVVTGSYFTMTVAPTVMSLGAGESTTFTVQYAPAAIGTHIGNVAITDGRAVTNVPLSGSAALLVNMTTGSKNIAVGETWNFYDSGGPSGNYLASENYTYTFYPPAGYRLIVAFNQFYTEEDYDFFKAYNGPTAGSTLLGNYHANLAPFTLNPTNAITFVFTSDSGVEYAGWFAQISLEQLPIGPTTEVILGPPGDPSLDMPAIGFLLNWTTTGGTPASYQVYMSQTESTVLEDVQFNTTETSLNPTTYTGGPTDPIVFNYGETWYWIVRAMNPDNAGGYIDAPRTFTFTIQDDPRVAVFPWTENFETHSDNSLPSGWTRTSNATGWEFGSDLSSSAFSIPSHTVYAAANDDAAGSGVDGSMDILTPPPFNFAGTYPGVPVLSFDSFFTGSYSQSAYLEITTNGTIWSPLYELTSNPAWTNVVVSLDAYDDLPFVQIRFHADDNSAWASGWAVDNVSVIYSTVDNFAPIVDHYPVIGWPYTGDPVVIYADIVDSPVLFTGISSATLNYTIDGGLPIAAPMSLVGATYQATIPAQVAGTVIAYSITAVDSSPALNSTTTPTWDFSINSPVWLQYDSGAETNNVGLASGTFGIMTGFANPYGVGKSCQISSITGGLSNAGTANVHVYTYDAITDTFTDLIPSFNFAFTAGTLQTIPLTGCVTTAQYFYVAYTDIVGPNYFKLDQTQTAYPGTHFIHFGAGISTLDLGTIEGSGFPGSWLIRAQVQPVAPVTTVTNPSGSPVITWDAVIGVASYKVYGASDPYAVDPWTLLTETTGLTYTYTGTEAMKFFKVTTVYAAPVRSAIVANTKSRNTSNIETTSPSKNVRLQTSDRK